MKSIDEIKRKIRWHEDEIRAREQDILGLKRKIDESKREIAAFEVDLRRAEDAERNKKGGGEHKPYSYL